MATATTAENQEHHGLKLRAVSSGLPDRYPTASVGGHDDNRPMRPEMAGEVRCDLSPASGANGGQRGIRWLWNVRERRTQTLLTQGSRAPAFSLQTSDGQLVRSSDYIGSKTVVIYFYPKDDTLGCTIESCAFRDSYEAFVDAGAEVIGISADPVSSHDAFRGKYRLPFVLASDPDRRTARAYGVTDGLFGVAGRATFVIDRQGIVRDAFASRFRVKKHATRALSLVRSLAVEG